ncbi:MULTISPECIES: hypothetical protein [unclassified Streptomyces]|uniref:hypothetical protein n=1 Tax=unclassified Streptomyces TaxID=2593676 RepID=UPI000365837E|nr:MULTISPECIES: hypothetical protein [unclassified Streptomyces]
MSDVREAARPQATVRVAPLRLVGGEAKDRTLGDAREAARPQATVRVVPLRLVGGAADGLKP